VLVITYFQAIVMGVVQGITELFRISSLGQAVTLPTVFGWDHLVQAQSQPESFFLAFLVGLNVATATALLIYFRSDWRAIIGGFFRTLGEGAHERKVP
jgi:undecaprenyl-diphosphatase